MGIVLTAGGEKIEIPDLEGIYNVDQLLNDVKSENYTIAYRTQVIKALGQLGKHAWGALTYLQDIVKSQKSTSLSEEALSAIKAIDPAAPDLDNIVPKKSKGARAADALVAGNATIPIDTGKKKKQDRQQVTIKEIDPSPDLGNGARTWGQCNFCNKICLFHGDLKKCCERVVGPNQLYCHFCIRNDLYQRYAKNTLILTFRGIIGYYYYCFHICRQPSMFMNDLHDYIELHIRLGVQNPLFRYDPESFLWFIDFSKVGTGRRKMPVEYILQTIIQILAGFNLYDNVRDCSPFKVYDKYREAIMDFYNHRKRPANHKILAPTLLSTGIPLENVSNTDKAIPQDLLRNFVPSMMTENQYWVKRQHSYS
jgi:hypothetical protein